MAKGRGQRTSTLALLGWAVLVLGLGLVTGVFGAGTTDRSFNSKKNMGCLFFMRLGYSFTDPDW